VTKNRGTNYIEKVTILMGPILLLYMCFVKELTHIDQHAVIVFNKY